MKPFLDIEAARNFIVKAMNHYQERNVPGWFVAWLDDLYIRLGENWGPITLDELATLMFLSENEQWQVPGDAVPNVFRLFDRLDRSLPE